MNSQVYFIIAIIVGVVMILTVLWCLVQEKTPQKRAILISLILLGSLLVSCPLWTRVIVKGPKWELTLYREIAKDQGEKTTNLIENLEEYIKNEEVAQELKKQREEIVALRCQIESVTAEGKNSSEAEKLAKKLSSVTSDAVALSKFHSPRGLRLQ